MAANSNNDTNIFTSLVGATLINNKKQEFKASDLANNKVIGLYFSAHWCGPCKMFTYVLYILFPLEIRFLFIRPFSA